jgi:hypothetical protein
MFDDFRRNFAVLSALVVFFGFAPAAFAQNKGKQNNKNDEAEIRAAQAKLDDAKKEASEAQKDAQEAQKHVAKVRSDLVALRRKIEDAAEGSKKLKQAHERVDKAKAALEPLVTPLLATVHQSPEYTTAARLRDDLRRQLGSTDNRAVLAKQIADAEGVLRKLETAAIERSPAAVKAKEYLTEAEADLRKELAAADDALAKDPKFAAAKRDLEKAENQAENAASKAAAKQKAVAAAQNKVQSEIAEERREDARERQQQQNKNKNKKKN